MHYVALSSSTCTSKVHVIFVNNAFSFSLTSRPSFRYDSLRLFKLVAKKCMERDSYRHLVCIRHLCFSPFGLTSAGALAVRQPHPRAAERASSRDHGSDGWAVHRARPLRLPVRLPGHKGRHECSVRYVCTLSHNGIIAAPATGCV